MDSVLGGVERICGPLFVSFLHVRMKLLLVALALSATHFSFEALLNNPEEILANFKSRYNNSKSDLIFLLDISLA